MQVICLRSHKGRFSAQRSLVVHAQLPDIPAGALLLLRLHTICALAVTTSRLLLSYAGATGHVVWQSCIMADWMAAHGIGLHSRATHWCILSWLTARCMQTTSQARQAGS